MRRILGLTLATCCASLLFAQTTTLNGPVNIKGQPGSANVLRLSFPITAPCPNGPISTPGTAVLCGHDKVVTLSVDGQPPFILGEVQPPVLVEGPPGPPGEAGKPVAPGAPGISAAPIDYALVTPFNTRVEASEHSWNMPEPLTELFGIPVRLPIDLSRGSKVRLFIQIGSEAGSIGGVIFCQYSLDGGATWQRLTSSAATGLTGESLSIWSDIPSEAKQDLLVRVVSDNGTNTPVVINSVHLQIK